MQISNEGIIKSAFGLAIGLFIFLGFFTHIRFQSYSDYTDIVEHTQVVIKDVVQARALHESMKSNQRSFLLTKDARYIENFKASTDSLKRIVSNLSIMTSDNPRQIRNTRALQKVTDLRISQMYLEMINDTSNSNYKFKQEKLLRDNIVTSDEFAALLQKMFEEENRLLKKRVKMQQYEAWFAPKLVVASSALAIILIIMAFYLLQNELKKRLRIQDLLEEKIKDLNMSNRQLEQFARVSSHDLQEPLRKISIFSDQLLTRYRGEISEPALRVSERINSSAVRMIALIKDILTFSNIASSGHDIEKTDVDVDKVWKSVVSDYSLAIMDKGATVTTDPLPIIRAFEYQIYQLLQNLLSNSLKFIDEERPLIVTLRHSVQRTLVRKDESYVHTLTFEDNGAGFDDTYAEKVFHIFGRLDRAKEGTGIGLAICKQIMENHGGEIKVQSTIGIGTTFTITFP